MIVLGPLEIFVNLLIGLHLLGLVLGMGSGLALGVLGPKLGSQDAGQREMAFALSAQMRKIGQFGLAILWVTGLSTLFFKYGVSGALTGMSVVFWLKIALVLVLSASIGIGSAAFKKVAAGDISARSGMVLSGKINQITAILIVFAAVFAFN